MGGPIGLIHEGDSIVIDALAKTIMLEVAPAELERRRAAWRAPSRTLCPGVLEKYARLVTSASRGAVTTQAAPR
jgi:dihydroxy-acid dehydratase